MNVTYINPFIVATRNLFKTMISAPLSLGQPFLRQRAMPQVRVQAVIGLSGHVSGIVALSFPEPVALALASSLSGEKTSFINDGCMDALGEIANMICGGAKKDFPGADAAEKLVQLSVPQVVKAPGAATFPNELPVLVILCDTSAGRFFIEVALHQPKAQAPAAAVVAA